MTRLLEPLGPLLESHFQSVNSSDHNVDTDGKALAPGSCALLPPPFGTCCPIAAAANGNPAAGTGAARSLSRKYPYRSECALPRRSQRGVATVRLDAPQPDCRPPQFIVSSAHEQRDPSVARGRWCAPIRRRRRCAVSDRDQGRRLGGCSRRAARLRECTQCANRAGRTFMLARLFESGVCLQTPDELSSGRAGNSLPGQSARAAADRRTAGRRRKPPAATQRGTTPKARQTIFSGMTHWSNCSPVRWPDAMAASRRLVPSLCAFFAMNAALS